MEVKNEDTFVRVEDPDVILIKVMLRHSDLPEDKIEMKMQLHRLRDVSDITDRVNLWLREVAVSVAYTGFRMLYRGQIVSKTVSLEEAGIIADAMVWIQLIEPTLTTAAENEEELGEDQYSAVQEINLDIEREAENAPRIIKVCDWQYPTRPKAGYTTQPDYDSVLLKMNKEQLSAVEEFSISNQHGRIQFLGPTDLVEVDLASDILIKARMIEVYP